MTKDYKITKSIEEGGEREDLALENLHDEELGRKVSVGKGKWQSTVRMVVMAWVC